MASNCLLVDYVIEQVQSIKTERSLLKANIAWVETQIVVLGEDFKKN